MSCEPFIYVGDAAAGQLIAFARERGFARLTLVADERTHATLGAALQARLAAESFTVSPVVLAGAEVVADERSLVQVFLRADPQCDAFLAVGSGTITDIVRFVSDRMNRGFVSLPTAPSVDGFTSAGAPLVIAGFKQTVQVRSPLAVFASLPTLCAAPQAMIAAGVGDMLGKYTSAADWQLGVLLWDEPYDEAAARRTGNALEKCVSHIDQIRRASPDGIAALIDGLIESGLSIADAGHSRPASGAEHHISHYWEMKLLREGRPAVLHGAKVGVASVAIAALYHRLRQISLSEAETRLDRAVLPDPHLEAQTLGAAFGPAAPEVAAGHQAFLSLSPDRFAGLRRQVARSWDRIQEVAASVPEPEALADQLRRVGGPVSPKGLGLSYQEACEGLTYGHYLRNRFTILKLARMLGLLDGLELPCWQE